jgi:Transposase DDE domain group 1
MQKNPTAEPPQTTPTEISPLFGGAKLVLDETPKAITPFGGLASFIEFLGQINYAQQVQSALPFGAPTSNNAIPLVHTFTAFMMAVVTGGRRFAHTQWLRADHALHAMLGMERFPGDDTIRNFFARFSQCTIEAFWRPLWKWSLEKLTPRSEGFHLDLDSTVLQRSGQQEGAAKGYNPTRPGRKSHHPLLAVLAEAPFILHGWLRSGNTIACSGALGFLQEALALLPRALKIRCVRADSGFFERSLIEFLQACRLPYIIVAKMTYYLRRRCTAIKEWVDVDENYAVAEFTHQLQGWPTPLRFVVVRERLQESKEAMGSKLLEVPGYTFRMWVTNRAEAPLEIWRQYNGRACVEQRIEELKAELSVQGFCMKSFWATEAAFLAVLFTFNLLSLYQQTTRPGQPYMQPATLRSAVFLAGAILGWSAKQMVVRLSAAWGGLQKHKPLIDRILGLANPTSPKLVQARSP